MAKPPISLTSESYNKNFNVGEGGEFREVERGRERERERERIVEEEEYGLGGESLMAHLKSRFLKMSKAL